MILINTVCCDLSDSIYDMAYSNEVTYPVSTKAWSITFLEMDGSRDTIAVLI